MEKSMRMTRKELLKFAEEVRDQARHAAVCAPVHGKDPVEFVEKIDLEHIVSLHFVAFEEDDYKAEESESGGTTTRTR